jgi:hypothetical protein
MTANNLSLSGSHLMKCQTALFGNKRIRLAGYSPLAVVNHHHPEGSVFSFFPSSHHNQFCFSEPSP